MNLDLTAAPGDTITVTVPAARRAGGYVLSAYDLLVLADGPAAYWAPLGGSTPVADLTGNNHTAAPQGGTPATTTLPSGEAAVLLDGITQHLLVASSADLSIATTGQLTVEAWVRPDVLDFPHTETSSDGPLINYLGKGETYGTHGQQEYQLRIYNRSSSRPNRMSGYVFNPAGGLGAGSYFQDPVVAGQWIHVVIVYDTVHKGADGWGTTTLYKNGVQRDQDSLGGAYHITPVAGSGSFRIGTHGAPSDSRGFFQGGIGKVAVYPTALPQPRVLAHYQAQVPAGL